MLSSDQRHTLHLQRLNIIIYRIILMLFDGSSDCVCVCWLRWSPMDRWSMRQEAWGSPIIRSAGFGCRLIYQWCDANFCFRFYSDSGIACTFPHSVRVNGRMIFSNLGDHCFRNTFIHLQMHQREQKLLPQFSNAKRNGHITLFVCSFVHRVSRLNNRSPPSGP